ncbi:MAG: hypothetical protein HPY62_01060 [Bacteroidales bacterium]|nr:hypothetical protein [Bacteroidales bacterium]
MKNLPVIIIISALLMSISCKEKESERFRLLTTPVWQTDSLIANGIDASGPGGFLEKFKGEAKFREDGTGYFGKFTGTWSFNIDETKLTITTDSLPLPITCDILELTSLSLKIKTAVINPANISELINIRMTFKAK